ncbi:MAG: hypothetical protein Q4E34_00070 [Synergistaceae bacterium]|nr:hypothetical protein [Synergistaceae bacterium]
MKAVISNTDPSVFKMLEKDLPLSGTSVQSGQPEMSREVCDADAENKTDFID